MSEREPRRCCGTCRFVERLKFRSQDGTIPLVCKEGKLILVKAHYGKKCPHWKSLQIGEDDATTV